MQKHSTYEQYPMDLTGSRRIICAFALMPTNERMVKTLVWLAKEHTQKMNNYMSMLAYN